MGWAWRNTLSKLVVVTCVNPDTGEHYAAKDSDFYKQANEPGYAGYIGLQGPAAAVSRAAKAIRHHAEYVKDECAGRRSYI